MFMGRLALQRGGFAIDDPFAWWDSLGEHSVAFWQAFYRCEPFGGDWHRHARQCQMLHSVAMRMAAGDGETLAEEKQFMPPDYVDLQTPEKPKIPIRKQLDALKRAQAKNG